MAGDGPTIMGGPGGSFENTLWQEIIEARTLDVDRRAEMMGKVLGRYWKPVYCYLRHRGFTNEQAKDLTQGFFCWRVLRRDLVQSADPGKGKFRTLLLSALDRYVIDEHRKASAAKRSPEGGVLSLEGLEVDPLPEPSGQASPEQAFHRTWAMALLDEALGEVHAGCIEDGLEAHWKIFQARCIRPILEGVEPESPDHLRERLGVSSNKQVSNMALTVKRRFAAAIRKRLREVAGSEAEVDDELRELMAVLSSGQGERR